MQERRNSSANALELRFSCTNPSICCWCRTWHRCIVSLVSLQWRHNGRDGVLNHQPHYCLLNRLFRRRSRKATKLRVTGLCAETSPVTGEFPAQMASKAENASIDVVIMRLQHWLSNRKTGWPGADRRNMMVADDRAPNMHQFICNNHADLIKICDWGHICW